MPFAAIARQGGEQRCLRSRFKIEGLGENFPVTRVSALTLGFGVVPNNNGTDVHQNNECPGQPYYSEEMEFEVLLYTSHYAAIAAWMKETMEGKNLVARKTLTYHILHPQQQNTVLAFNLHDCWVKHLEILGSSVDQGNDVAKFLMRVAVARITVQ
jgi:hypothetical protein